MSKIGRNDPCPCGSGKKYKHCHFGKADDVWAHAAPEPPAPPTYASGLPPVVVDLPPTTWDDEEDLYDDESLVFTPLDEAWELIDEAWEEDDPKRRLKLANQALKLSPDCAGAYYILGLHEESPEAGIRLFDKAIDVAQRVIEPRTLEQLAPFDWIDPEVEYAMYSLLYKGLAQTAADRMDAALDTLRYTVSLDPADRVRARMQLILLLMANGESAEAAEVERQDPDPGADPIMAYASALLRFQRDGDSVFARRALAEAIMMYPENADLLTKFLGDSEAQDEDGQVSEETDEDVEQAMDDVLSLIEAESEDWTDPVTDTAALHAVLVHDLLWRSTEGAAEWLEAMRAAGPGIRYDNGFLGDGPALLMTESKQRDYRHCPHCHRPTDFLPLDLVVQADPNEIVDFEIQARRCPKCDIVCIATDDLYSKAAKAHPGIIGLDFVPLGFIPKEVNNGRPKGTVDEHWLRENVRPWRTFEDYDAKRTEWPTIESQQQEIEEWMRMSGLRDLLGPLPTIEAN